MEGAKDVSPGQQPFARRKSELRNWNNSSREQITLFDVIRNSKATALLGVSGQAGVFTEDAVREMAKHTNRPIIFPLSNPTSRAEATPENLLHWTDGRALIGTGSPFAPVDFDSKSIHICQTNNSYIFPVSLSAFSPPRRSG